MPIYEFRCNQCQARASLFTHSIQEPVEALCPSCGSRDLARLISSFAYHKSLKAINEEAGEPSLNPSPDYYKDPRNIGRWTEKRLKDMGMEVPQQVQEMISAARDGDMSILDKRGL